MKRGISLSIAVAVGFVVWMPVITWAQNQVASRPHTIMHPDNATMLQWFQAHEAMPKGPLAPQAALLAPGASLSLLSHLDYVPAERDQGYCGDCWCWAGHGCLEILLHVQNGIFDRLSVQEMNSCESAVIGLNCCNGGWLSDLQAFYSAAGYQRVVPWSNPGANWQDGGAACATPCASITATPNYPVQSIRANSITTRGVGQAQAIANIKAVLNQNKPVAFAFFLATQNDWNTFDNFWDYQSESTTINLDYACGHTWDSGGGGHEVLCVGYNDTDPNNPYWIMVNSWGTTGGRPNGIFHVSMTNNYDCTYNYGGSYPSYYWEYLDVTYTTTSPQLSVSPTSLSQTITQGQNAVSQSFGAWNAGGGNLNYTISTNAPWLSVSPTNGASSGATNSHTVAYSSANLAAGSYSGTITVSAPAANNSPQTISVSLTVLPQTSTIGFDVGYLYDKLGALARTNSIAVLVVDVGSNGFVNPQPAFPLSLGTTWGTEDRIVGRWDLSGCSDCGAGWLYDHTIVTYTNGIAPGQKLQLYWFPSLTLASNTVGVTYYGKLTDTNSPPLCGGDAWKMPVGGSTVQLQFYTASIGGPYPETNGFATLFTGVPASDAFTAWQMRYFGCTNCPQAGANADPLGKGMSNTNQFLAGLNPTNSASVFRIISVIPQGNDVAIAWATVGGKTNVVQVTAGGASGSYVTNLINLSGLFIISGSGDTATNYLDLGGATNRPARFYRVRLVQ